MYEKCYCYLIKQLQNSRSGVPITFGIKTKKSSTKSDAANKLPQNTYKGHFQIKSPLRYWFYRCSSPEYDVPLVKIVLYMWWLDIWKWLKISCDVNALRIVSETNFSHGFTFLRNWSMIILFSHSCLFSNDLTDFFTMWKVSKYGVFFWSECGKIRTRKNSVFGHFSRSTYLQKVLIQQQKS